MMNFIIHIRSLWRYLKLTRCGCYTPHMDIWNERGALVPVDVPEYRELVHAYMQMSLHEHYLRKTRPWKIWRKFKRYRQALEREETTSEQLEFDF